MKDYNKDFYIGYQGVIKHKQVIVIAFLTISILLLFSSFTLLSIFQQEKSNDFSYLYESKIELTGKLIVYPEPIFIVEGEDSLSIYLLVGKGKKGVRGILNQILPDTSCVEYQQVKISGMPINGSPYSALEIENKQDIQVITYHKTSEKLNTSSSTQIMLGELLDSKCYLGVMKPGYGLLHRICAINCLKGGLPLLFKENLTNRVFIVTLNKNINENEFHLYAGKHVSITCQIQSYLDVPFLSVSSVDNLDVDLLHSDILNCK